MRTSRCIYDLLKLDYELHNSDEVVTPHQAKRFAQMRDIVAHMIEQTEMDMSTCISSEPTNDF